MQQFAIAPATTPADMTAVAELFRAYAAGLGTDLAYQGFAQELAGLPGKYAPPAGALLLARDAGRAEAGAALGCVAMRPLAGTGACEMKRLYVAPAGRGHGLGRALVTAVATAARTAGYAEIRLDTLPGMATAQALYAALGFRPIAPYYDTPVAGTVFMALRLTD